MQIVGYHYNGLLLNLQELNARLTFNVHAQIRLEDAAQLAPDEVLERADIRLVVGSWNT